MELTQTGPVVVLVVVALGLFALVVVGWPRRGGRAARGVVRGGQVLLLNLVVVALAGALLNDQYLFYSSWSDLLGARSAGVQLHHGGGTRQVVDTAVAGPGLKGVTGAASFVLPQPHARLQTYTVTDPRSGAAGHVLVYLPVGYDPTSSRTYPVVLALHGFPSSPLRFTHINVLPTIDRLTATHRLAPSIVVMPPIDTPATLDTECVNGPPGTPQTDTWLSRDLPAWVVTHLHARRDRLSWAAFGYSYGAWCAASLSMRHPDVFGAAIVLQGYFRPDFSAGYDPLTTAGTEAYDLIRIARTSPPPLAMYVLASRQDTLSYPSTSRFLSVAKPPLDVTAVILATGGHRESVWLPYVSPAMAWLGQTLPGFHA
ncbi:MAG TPA: alpha/beta hydrolase-fold protein [Phycicoccus sp.]|nr:alpha/beta hydrolase-fold protein [Phycicoccus sp.]